jgi:tetratricopeptide (TPR) repeat protein
MARHRSTITRSIIAGLSILAFAGGAAAQPAADASGASGAWEACLKAPTRVCVLQAAAEAARAIPARNDDFDQRASILSQISDAQFAAGLSTEAATTIDEALWIATPIKSIYAHDEALREIAKVLARAGRLADATSAAGSIRSQYFQPEAIGDIAVVEGRAGRLDDALRRTLAIEDPRTRARVTRRVAWDLRAAAVARGEDGKIVAALAAVQDIEQQVPRPMFYTGIHHPSEFPPALAIIAQAQARAGRIEDAMQTTQLVADSRERSEAFTLIADVLAQAGATASALKVARAADDREEVLGAILDRRLVRKLAALDLRPAREIAAEEEIARSSVQAETPGDALDVSSAFADTRQHPIALAIVATAFAKSGRPAEAAEIAAAINGKPGAFAWRAIAEAQAKAGQSVQSIASFDRAVQAALSFDPHDSLLTRIAVSQAEAGQIDDALHVTTLIGRDRRDTLTGGDRRDAFRAIAKAQARAGVPPGPGVDAEALAEAGRIDEAVKAVVKESRAFQRSDLLAQIAKARAAAGRIGEAKQVAQHIADARDKVGALASVAAAQMKAGLRADAMASFAEALQIARSLPSKNVAAEELIRIAAMLPN